MCTVTYNVSAVLCLMIDVEAANTVNTLLFHGYDDIGPCNIVILVVHNNTQLDTHHMCIEVRLYIQQSVKQCQTTYIYIYIYIRGIMVKRYVPVCSIMYDQSPIMSIMAIHFKMTGVKF